MEFLNLPKDLEIKIYEYNPEHRELFSKCFHKIRLNGVKSRLNYLIRNVYYEGTWTSFTDMLAELVNDQDYMVKILKTCQCCVRHIQNRPKSLEDPSWWVAASQEPHNTNKCELYGCACTCRQCSRQLVISSWKKDSFLDYLDEGYLIVSDYENWESDTSATAEGWLL
uniref:Uncharacterized protein n=1 Tax=viral metagenome TaxID=1070528 RepID=A0A6C0KYU9_9ZZZZ|tara:strand:+ start:86 stop:589 length:504 start_codon:yes stop_codon:yes gene_type:complete